MLAHAKVKPKTYAGELISDLYDEIFHRSLELKHDYSTYYAVEYATFDEYVRKRFLFEAEQVCTISDQFVQSDKIILFHPTQYFLEEDYGPHFVEKLLEPARNA